MMFDVVQMLYPLATLLLVAGLIPVARWLAMHVQFVDRPGGRKQHEGAIPPVGGLIVFPVFIAVAFAHGVTREAEWFLAGLALLLLTGACDDAIIVPPHIKFAVQWVVALIIVMPGAAQAHNLGNLLGFGPIVLGQAGSIIFSVVATVLLVNAINLMDGLDGLASGEGFIILFWLGLCALLFHPEMIVLPALLMAALAGFLIYNMRHPWRARASVFLGDSGSLALGLSLAWFAIHFSQGSEKVIRPVGIAWLLALPIFDTCGQFARRVAQGRHPFDADEHHFHHHFIYIGLTPGRATVTILAVSFGLALIGVGGLWLGIPEAVLSYLWIVLLLLHIYMSMRPRRFRRLMAQLRGKNIDMSVNP